MRLISSTRWNTKLSSGNTKLAGCQKFLCFDGNYVQEVVKVYGQGKGQNLAPGCVRLKFYTKTWKEAPNVAKNPLKISGFSGFWHKKTKIRKWRKQSGQNSPTTCGSCLKSWWPWLSLTTIFLWKQRGCNIERVNGEGWKGGEIRRQKSVGQGMLFSHWKNFWLGRFAGSSAGSICKVDS